jgi:hypothetical protein
MINFSLKSLYMIDIIINNFFAHDPPKMFKLSIFADLQILVCPMTKFVMSTEREYRQGRRYGQIVQHKSTL